MSQAAHERMATRGWWVGHREMGGVLVVETTPGRARRVGADELGVEYLEVTAARVPALDGQPPGIVDWDEAIKLGAAVKCAQCGWEWAVTRNAATMCGECGAPLPTPGVAEVHPARRGDLAVVQLAFGPVGRDRYILGTVAGVRQDGRVTAIRRIAGSQEVDGDIEHRSSLWGTVYIVERERVDAAKVRRAMRTEERDEFTLLDEVKALLKACMKAPVGVAEVHPS